ncbi:MAG: hydroxyacid dehydrogenase [Hyphomicrobiales bacterium]|nr:hydroxyacid dehydrogenase [Hyphomicrobiales bacterium]
MSSRKPTILFDPFPRNEEMVFDEAVASELAELSNLVTHFGSRAPDELVDDILPEVDIIVGQTAMPKERLERAPNLKAILNVKANWEPNIDYVEAQSRGIYVLSAAPAMAPAVAEACIGYAIALGRRTVEAHDKFRLGKEKYGIAGNRSAYSLFGAKVGLLGFGNLGRALVPLLEPFGCKVSVHDPWLSNAYLQSEGVTPLELDDLLSTSRFLFILAGVTVENEGFVDRARLEQVPEDAAVILASRAEVTDFDALIDLASQGRFRAAIDVFPEEPVPADAPFRSAPNILFTAHLAGGLHFSYAGIRDMMMDDIRQILAGRAPLRMQRAEPLQAALMRSR